MKSYNINSTVKVRLTEYGKQMLEKDQNEFWSSYGRFDNCPYEPKEEDEGGYVEFQLWSLMEELGRYCTLGGEMPFDTVILIKEDDLRS